MASFRTILFLFFFLSFFSISRTQRSLKGNQLPPPAPSLPSPPSSPPSESNFELDLAATLTSLYSFVGAELVALYFKSTSTQDESVLDHLYRAYLMAGTVLYVCLTLYLLNLITYNTISRFPPSTPLWYNAMVFPVLAAIAAGVVCFHYRQRLRSLFSRREGELRVPLASSGEQ